METLLKCSKGSIILILSAWLDQSMICIGIPTVDGAVLKSSNCGVCDVDGACWIPPKNWYG